MEIDSRRTDRLMLTVPIWVMGAHPKGFPFIEDARTIILNRDGALIHIFRPLRSGQSVLVVNLITQREADFRVVGPVAPFTENGGEYGIECLQDEENIWDIQFPSPAEGGADDPRALLECRKCRAVALLPLSLIEIEVLRTSGLIPKPCRKCREETTWGYPEKKVAMEGPPEMAEMFEEAQAQAAGREQRKDRRVALQVPLLVRNFDGVAEVARTENSSQGGFCFLSDSAYQIGQGVTVACPYDPAGQSPAVLARIVRRQSVEGTGRTVYGVRYEPPGE